MFLEESDYRRLLAARETTPGCPVAVAAGPTGGRAGDVARAALRHDLVVGLVRGLACVAGAESRKPWRRPS